MRRLIVNADDFGLSAGVNAGIVQAHESGIVTSTSLMVHHGGAAAAAQLARALPSLGVGLHVDLGEWSFRDGSWVALYERVDLDDATGIEAEVALQLARFRSLLGRDPDHLDSHQHVHRREPALGVLQRLGRELGVPVRRGGMVGFVGEFYGQDDEGQPLHTLIGVERLLVLLERIGPDCTELACHPGQVADDDTLGGTMYRVERNLELRTLCDPRVRARLARGDIVLSSFAECPPAPGGSQ